MAKDNNKRTLIDTTPEAVKLVKEVSDISGIAIPKVTDLLITYAVEAFKKDPTILTTQHGKNLVKTIAE